MCPPVWLSPPQSLLSPQPHPPTHVSPTTAAAPTSSRSPSSASSRVPVSNAQPLASPHHMHLPHAAPFILGKRVRGAGDGEEENGSPEAVAVSMGGNPAAQGFWALPARDFGHHHPQLWSFAPPHPHAQEMMVAAPSPAMSGEASAARVGNYLPMAQANLNLLASFSGGPGGAASAGRAEEETTAH